MALLVGVAALLVSPPLTSEWEGDVIFRGRGVLFPLPFLLSLVAGADSCGVFQLFRAPFLVLGGAVLHSAVFAPLFRLAVLRWDVADARFSGDRSR
jgi:hypothetical protein